MEIHSAASSIGIVGSGAFDQRSTTSKTVAAAYADKTDSSSLSTPQAKDRTETPTDPIDVRKAAQKIQDAMSSLHGKIQFSVDEGNGKTIIKVVDSKTKDVLMQLPSKTALAIAETLGDGRQGNLISEKV